MAEVNVRLRRVFEASSAFSAELGKLSSRGESDLERVEPIVKSILDGVRREGDGALRRYVQELEQRTIDAVIIEDYGGREALEQLRPEVRDALCIAAERIRRYHDHQAAELKSSEYTEAGVTLGGRVTPLERVGVYAPGGKASYPSSVLMCAVPAAAAGVSDVIVACPDLTPEVRAACHLSGVRAVLNAGGAQAIAALAFGTESVPRVDKIVGPGNLYVAAAKRLVFGAVSIDGIAGPSEILVLADDSARADVIAADLLSQAEHDEAAYPIFACTSAELADAVDRELSAQLLLLPERDASGRPRREVARASLQAQGVAFVVNGREGLSRVANQLAAEHVSIQTREPRELATKVKHAGALFIGASTPEAAGDYLAGPSHVLPTGGAARYGAPLGVYDFVSRSSLVEYELEALRAQAGAITALSRVEGLEAHARAVEIRLRRRETR